MSNINSPQQSLLVLEDGTVFQGKSFGKKGTTSGEICFNTGMTGYQEVFTDPSYYEQVVIMNNVHIGNYGINDLEVESDSVKVCLLYTSPSPRDRQKSRMPSSA